MTFLRLLSNLKMEAGGSVSRSRPKGIPPSPSDDCRTAGGASKYLANLPSRGLFSNTVSSSNLGGIRVYVCDHETAPPDEQLIKTNSTNILIRALQINKQKSDSKDATAKATSESKKGKRSSERTSEGRTPAKRVKTNTASGSIHQEGNSTGFSQRMLQSMTVEQLRALLKERGLTPRGKKDELIARLQNDA